MTLRSAFIAEALRNRLPRPAESSSVKVAEAADVVAGVGAERHRVVGGAADLQRLDADHVGEGRVADHDAGLVDQSRSCPRQLPPVMCVSSHVKLAPARSTTTLAVMPVAMTVSAPVPVESSIVKVLPAPPTSALAAVLMVTLSAPVPPILSVSMPVTRW